MEGIARDGKNFLTLLTLMCITDVYLEDGLLWPIL